MSLRSKLVVSFAGVILLALGLAGAAAIALRWRAEQQATLDRLAVESPQLALDLFRLQRQGATMEQITAHLQEAARQRDLRVLLVARDGTVTFDSGNTLRGKRLELPQAENAARPPRYRSWQGRTGEQGKLVFVSAGLEPERRPGPEGGRGLLPISGISETVVVAVPKQTVTRAWLGLLPGLAWAGLIALAVSVLVALLLARSIAEPLRALTHASEEMARGNYDQAIPLRRTDEVGRLAAAFNGMARQVGRSHVQMRALIANVSHDLKTPLTSILGFSQALRDGDIDGPQARETAGIIHEEAVRVRALVDDLLYLSEIDARQVVIAAAPLDVAVLVARAARRFELPLRERGIGLSAVLPAEGTLFVQADSAKLERVLDNLMDNARKYTPAGGTVEVRAGLAGGAMPGVRLEVFNSGPRIPDEVLSRMFERFYRYDRTRGRTGGSGLGLSIAKELVELHGGTLTATSSDTGMTLTVHLPRFIAPTEDTRQGTAANQPETTAPSARLA
jgi:signal transduction histidine kinase